MNNKTFLAIGLLAMLTAPANVFADGGYGTGGDIPYGSRAIHLLTNEARCDTAEALKNCGTNNCKELADCQANYDSATGKCKNNTRCIYPAATPYWWNDELYKSAQMHTNMFVYTGCFNHTSPCELSTTIGTDFPTCDGKPSCACKNGTASCSGSGTFFVFRIEKFITSSYYKISENIAKIGDHPTDFKNTPHHTFFK